MAKTHTKKNSVSAKTSPGMFFI